MLVQHKTGRRPWKEKTGSNGFRKKEGNNVKKETRNLFNAKKGILPVGSCFPPGERV